jgi:type II secretory ATPase GspE/PulE/Tfp pilus assembly ATPase PilB-like protein
MAAIKQFEKLLKKIEESNLNYSRRKTPFSANILLKCSYIKRFSDLPNSKDEPILVRIQDSNFVSVKNLEYEKIKSENDALKKELSSLREAYN